MHRSRVIVILGVLVALLPFFGFPRAWEAFFQVVAGFGIAGFSMWATIDKKLSMKAKAQMRSRRRPVASEGASEDPASNAAPAVNYGRRASDFYPKTGQPGRRVSDFDLPVTPPAPEANPEEGTN